MIGLDDVKQLLAQADDHTLSLYLAVDPALQENQATIPAWRIWLKNALKGVEKDLGDTQRDNWNTIRSRLDTFLDTYVPDSKGLALFYGPKLDQVHPLPVPVENRIAFGKPLIAPLVWAIDEYQPYLVVMVDTEKASFIKAYLGRAGQQDTMTLEMDTSDWREKTLMPPSFRRNAAAGVTHGDQRERFEDRVEEWVGRFYKDVAERIVELAQEQGIERIVIGGNEESAHAVHKLLPEKLTKAVVDVQGIPMRYTPHEVLSQILPTALDHEREHEMNLVEQVVNLAKAGGRGALGKEAVLHALEQQRVELLIVPWPLPDGDGLMTELPMRAMESGCAIEMVHGEAAERVKAEGGLAARLYYAL